MKIGILTGGGDCPGLNAVIRAVVRKGIFTYEDEFVGFLEGWRGLIENNIMELNLDAVGGILPAVAPSCAPPAPIRRSALTASTVAWLRWRKTKSTLLLRSVVTTLSPSRKSSTSAEPKLSASLRLSTTILAAPTTPSALTPPAISSAKHLIASTQRRKLTTA